MARQGSGWLVPGRLPFAGMGAVVRHMWGAGLYY